MRRRRPDGVGADRAVGLRRHVEKRLGLAVELLEVQPQRAIEGEKVGADRFAGGVGDADSGEAEDVLERSVDERFAERIVQPRQHRNRLPVDDLFAPFPGDAEKVPEHRALDRPGVLHPDHHAGQQGLEDARRREVKGRPDLAQIVLRGVGAFGAGHAEAGDETLGVVEIMVADPGQRQVGQHLVAIGQLVERHGVAGGGDAAFAGQHHPFRAAGGAGGVEDHRGVGAPARFDPRIERRRDCGIAQRRLASRDHPGERNHPGVPVVRKAALLVVENARQQRQSIGDGQDLVDLLLVLGDDQRGFGMAEHIGHLVGHRVGIDRQRNGAEHLRRGDRPVEPRPVGADNGDLVAMRQPEPREPLRQRAGLGVDLRPGPGPPDAEVLVAERRTIRAHAGVLAQQLGESVRALTEALALWRQ